ncbi:hypothetical protein ILP97_48950 [Amycolatopsis sp. H6(2020)]|nr:hypothetical protein [Amycolatopsis sp. H6(2020)]
MPLIASRVSSASSAVPVGSGETSLPESRRYPGTKARREVRIITAGERDALKHRHTDWLSVHPSGF